MRSATFPLSGQREFLRLLAPYLAENIDVFHPRTGRYGLLRGLPATYEGQGEPLADVEFYVDADAREEACGDITEPVAKILPVLYAFEDLATEICLPDGRRVVPAVEVAKQWHSNIKRAEIIDDYDGYGVTCVASGAGIELSISKQGFDSGTLGDWLAQLLRRGHFAVGLAPEQYHRKQVASACQGCAGCDKGKEVARG